MIENYLRRSSDDTLSRTEQFLNLSGAFEETTAEELPRAIRKSRKDSKRFESRRGRFD